MAMKPLVKRVFTIFATNASFLREITNFQIQLSKICNIYHVIVHFLPKKHCFLLQNAPFLPKDLQKVRKSRQILLCDKIAYNWAQNFRPSPNFSAGPPMPPHNFCHPAIHWFAPIKVFSALFLWIQWHFLPFFVFGWNFLGCCRWQHCYFHCLPRSIFVSNVILSAGFLIFFVHQHRFKIALA